MHKITLPSLRTTSSVRPAGYYESVVALGRIENDVLFLEDSVYAKLRKKYAPPISLKQKALNLAGAGGRVVKAVVQRERVIVSQEEQIRRQLICNGCEFFNGTSCAKCGCVIKFKSRLETEHCPINKW